MTRTTNPAWSWASFGPHLAPSRKMHKNGNKSQRIPRHQVVNPLGKPCRWRSVGNSLNTARGLAAPAPRPVPQALSCTRRGQAFAPEEPKGVHTDSSQPIRL
eukprot:EG_transcript_62081